MLRRPILIEGALMVLVLFLGLRLYHEVEEYRYTGDATETYIVKGSDNSAYVPENRGPAAGAKETDRSAYEVIALKNIFNPARKEHFETGEEEAHKKTKKVAPQKKPPMGPPHIWGRAGMNKRDTLVLEGVLIFNDRRVALIRDIVRPKEGVKNVVEGATIDGYTVDSIMEDKVVLKGDDGKEKVLFLYDSTRPVRRRHLKTTKPELLSPVPFAPVPPGAGGHGTATNKIQKSHGVTR